MYWTFFITTLSYYPHQGISLLLSSEKQTRHIWQSKSIALQNEADNTAQIIWSGKNLMKDVGVYISGNLITVTLLQSLLKLQRRHAWEKSGEKSYKRETWAFLLDLISLLSSRNNWDIKEISLAIFLSYGLFLDQFREKRWNRTAERYRLFCSLLKSVCVCHLLFCLEWSQPCRPLPSHFRKSGQSDDDGLQPNEGGRSIGLSGQQLHTAPPTELNQFSLSIFVCP